MILDNRLIAATIATEVPPVAKDVFPIDQISLARHLVAEVIWNRYQSKQWGPNPIDVVLARRQFSAVLREEYWFKAVLGDWFPNHVVESEGAWRLVSGASAASPAYSHVLPPSTLWYYSPISMVPRGRVPDWAASLVRVPVDGINDEYFRFFRRP